MTWQIVMVCNVYDGPFNPVMYSFFMYKGFLNAVGFHLDSCQSRFLLAHKEVDLASHPVIGLVLQEGSAEKFSQPLGFEVSSGTWFRTPWILFSESASKVLVSQP